MQTPSDRGDAPELSCFVIGPIGDRDADLGTPERDAYEAAIEVLERIIEPACAACDITVFRADTIAKPGEIPDQVFRSLRSAFLVIADLTGGNANVMYELGLRHTTGKLTIQIGERGKLPFDVSVIRTILFKRTEGGFIQARRDLSAAIGAGLKDGGDPVTATRIWFEVPAVSSDSSLEAPTEDEDDEPGSLEKLVDMSESLGSAAATLGALTEVINEITAIMTEFTEKTVAVNASGGDPQARLVLANAMAHRLAEPASRYQVLVGEYAASVERMNPGMTDTLEQARAQAGENESAKSYLERAREMIEAIDQLYEKGSSFREVAELTSGISKSLRKVYRGIIASTDRLLGTRTIFDRWRGIIDGDIPASGA
ncbi:MAG: hypothetical protein ACXW5U_27875 [Thermoanaerobaculia bacterium]